MRINNLASVKEVGQKIKAASEKYHCPVEALAEILGCTQNDIELVFEGKRHLDNTDLQKLSSCFGVSVSDILDKNVVL